MDLILRLKIALGINILFIAWMLLETFGVSSIVL